MIRLRWLGWLCIPALTLGSLGVAPGALAAQDSATVRVRVRDEAGRPVATAAISAGARNMVADSTGLGVLRLAAGGYRLVVSRAGFRSAAQELRVAAGADTTLTMVLRREVTETAEALEEIVVSSTRTGRRIEDEPTRVEVLVREEVEEKMLMTPGDVSMMLNETGGLRVQVTSPGLGGANVRVQGLRGRYTQILSDGLPLYGGQSGSLNLLQIPPMDLGQVEVIKGVASALYGASALGGVVNLISRRPGEERERELLLNASTLGGGDAVGYVSGRIAEQWSYTFLGGTHGQRQHDRDDDQWADLPGYRRLVARPRLFWDGGEGRSVFATIGFMAENRDGGGRVPGGRQFEEALATGRLDGGLVGRYLLGADRLFAVRASGMSQRHRHHFGEIRERDVHATGFGEATLSGAAGGHAWLLGAALQHERYRAEDVAGFDYRHTTPSIFAQDEFEIAEWLVLSASGRLDRHSEFGAFFSPRLSFLLRPGEWTARASIGTGYYAPTPFTEATEAIGLSRLAPPRGLKAERAQSASLDVGRSFGELELNATVFGSRVEGALQLRNLPVRPAESAFALELVNAAGVTRTYGSELLARFHADNGLHLTASHTFLRSTEPDPDGPGLREVPLTPRHAIGVVGMWEAEGQGRVGAELYYTGRQTLEDNPYRSTSEPYLILGLLMERRIRRARWFVNAENLLDMRQTRYDPLVLPARSREGRWTTDAWAPLEGRAVNAGVRFEF